MESIAGPIGNKAKTKTEVSSDNMAENLVKKNPGENPVRMTSEATVPEEWVVPILEKSEAVKLVSYIIDKLTKLNVQDWIN